MLFEIKVMIKKRFAIFLIISIPLIFCGYFLLRPAFSYLSGFLSKSSEVNADILIVEGWLPDYSLDMAYKEYRNHGYKYIITTGMKSVTPYFNVSSNGYLIFYPHLFISAIQESVNHTIEVDAYSQMGGENKAHFNLYINDSLAAGFFAEKRKKKYEINWCGKLQSIDSISIKFDNDSWGDFGDRNLLVKNICIDRKITIPYLNNSAYAIINSNGLKRIRNSVISDAEIAKERMIALGIDSSKISAVSAERVSINRTLTNALALRSWLDKTDITVKGINIISLGPHARRTWMTYNKILDEKYKIGIISLPDDKASYSKGRILRTLRETLGIIYYWFILLPY